MPAPVACEGFSATWTDRYSTAKFQLSVLRAHQHVGDAAALRLAASSNSIRMAASGSSRDGPMWGAYIREASEFIVSM